MSIPPWEIGLGGVSAECPNEREYRNWRKEGKTKQFYVTKYCVCGVCAVCGHPLHCSLHMHAMGGKPGDAPYGHRFVPKEAAR